jgi:hypothetical protein
MQRVAKHRELVAVVSDRLDLSEVVLTASELQDLLAVERHVEYERLIAVLVKQGAIWRIDNEWVCCRGYQNGEPLLSKVSGLK